MQITMMDGSSEKDKDFLNLIQLSKVKPHGCIYYVLCNDYDTLL